MSKIRVSWSKSDLLDSLSTSLFHTLLYFSQQSILALWVAIIWRFTLPFFNSGWWQCSLRQSHKTASFENYEVYVIVMMWYYYCIAPLPKAFCLCSAHKNGPFIVNIVKVGFLMLIKLWLLNYVFVFFPTNDVQNYLKSCNLRKLTDLY